MKHIKQLDAVRAIAVLLVLIWHGFPLHHLINRVPNGPIGVNMFFVLSGFLISRILMTDKRKAEQAGLSRLLVFKNFFVRRALRIFPIYYLLIVILWAVNGYAGSNTEANMGYFLTYTSNFYFFKIRQWDGILSHTWSLAIEEQFYLVWPWLILFVHKRFLLPLIGSIIVLGVAAQYAVAGTFGDYLPHACLNAFGAGAFLAWVMVYRSAALPRIYPLLVGLSIVAFLVLCFEVVTGHWYYVPVRIIVAVMTTWLIAHILYKPDSLYGPFSWVLNNKALIFLGKISYGIYLYHPVVPRYTSDWLARMNQYIPVVGNHLLFIEQCALIILTAWLSWRLIEQPLLRLKRFFILPERTVKAQPEERRGQPVAVTAATTPD